MQQNFILCGRYSYDSGYKKVTDSSPRSINTCQDYPPRQDPLSPCRGIPFVILSGQIIEAENELRKLTQSLWDRYLKYYNLTACILALKVANFKDYITATKNNTVNPQQPNQMGFQNQPRQNQQQNLPRPELQQPSEYKTLENTLTQFMAQTSAYMARTDRFIQKTDAFMDRTEMKLQNHDATLKSLETQVGQISQMLNTRPIGGFPSDTKVAKGATHEQCKAITTRSGRILEPTTKQAGTAASPSAATDTPAEAKIPAMTDKDHEDPHTTTGESSVETSHNHIDKSEVSRPTPPFPQRLKKQKQDYQFKKFFDILKQVHINLPLVEALQQMPNYAKFLKDMVTRKKRIEEFETDAATETCLALMHNKIPAKKTDPGSFTIECFIGHNYPTKALCDPGASINLMPKSVFRKLGIGEAKPTTVMLQLADHSYVQPEGKIEDILVKVDKFIFPADFLILDCEADENAPIILGRPFLSTSRAVIDFDKDEIVFKVDDDRVNIKSLTKQLNKGKGIAKSPAKDIPRTKLYIGAHIERDRAAMSLRDA
ncbi:hypothetical protein V6N12_035444 [Hibiscus sabdariffa]|uniref:Retrotransposon gag protein n=1 Tax=Hibiscus sabdariffa TaxID=183260 RepID=A0ABR2EMR8_9ROSI